MLNLKSGMKISIQAINDHSAIITTQPQDYVAALSGLEVDVCNHQQGPQKKSKRLK